MDLKGKVAVVTGAARGIGFACCEALLQNHAKVCLADILEDGEKSKQQLSDKYGEANVCYVKCNVTSEEEFENVFKTAKKTFGRVDLLVNNAGIGDEFNWELTVDVNLKGTIRGFNLALKHLGFDGEKLRGSIVNISSITGIKPTPFGPVYSATKHAIVGFTRSYGLPLNFEKYGVKVHAICPAAVDTVLMNTVQDHCLHPEIAKPFSESLDKMPPSVIGEAVIKVLQDGISGSCLIVYPGQQPKYAVFPSYDKDE